MIDVEDGRAAALMRDGVDDAAPEGCGSCRFWMPSLDGDRGVCSVSFADGMRALRATWRRVPDERAAMLAAECVTGEGEGLDCPDWRVYE